jgi:hypothetical protein
MESPQPTTPSTSTPPPHRKMTLPVVPTTPVSALMTPSMTDDEGFMRPWAEWEFNEWETCTDTDCAHLLVGLAFIHAELDCSKIR